MISQVFVKRFDARLPRHQLDPRMSAYAATAALFAVGTAAAVMATDGWHGNVWVVAALCVTAALAERGRVQLSRGIQESISLVPTLFAAVMCGPAAGMLVAAASFALELSPAPGTPSPRTRWMLYTSTRSLTGATTALVARAAGLPVHGALGSTFVATGAGALAGQVADAMFALATYKIRRLGRSFELLRAVLPLSLAAVPLYAPVVALLVYSYQRVSPLALPLFLIPAAAAQRLFVLYQAQRRLTDELVVANKVLEGANLSFATALVATLDARDRYTAGHSTAVAAYAREIAARIGLPRTMQETAYVAGLVHDIGKIGLPAGLLEKTGALTLEERRQMERHPVIGERILECVETYGEIASIVRHHHERVDGHGYPDGLAGENIPLLARIITVADAYDAMTSDRPYRDAMPERVARLRLAQAVGTQFDTAVVAALEALLTEAGDARSTSVGEQPTGGSRLTGPPPVPLRALG